MQSVLIIARHQTDQRLRRFCSISRVPPTLSGVLCPKSIRFSRNNRPYRTSARWWHRESSINSAPAANAAQLAVLDDYDTEDGEFGSLELLTHSHMSSHVMDPEGRAVNSLDLELGEHTWSDEEDLYNGNYELIEEEDPTLVQPSHLHPVQSAEGQVNSTEPTDDPERRSFLEIIRQFNPEEPPSTDDPEEIQLWLECSAHREGVLKYQRILDNARHRQDYRSMPMFQKQVLRWFPKLRDEIARIQSEYLVKKNGPVKKSLKRYGPFLCTLTPEKLAVIAAHESLMICLTKASKKGLPGVPFLAVTKRLGEAVEQEVLVQRMLYERAMEQRKQMKKLSNDGEKKDDSGDSTEDTMAEEESISATTLSGDPPETDELNVDGAPPNWMYALSHLNRYLEDLSRNDLTMKKRRIVKYAVKKARTALEKEEWSETDRVGLGSALLSCLLENAFIQIDGCDVPAFSHEKRWVGKSKAQGIVILHSDMLERFLYDDIAGLSATTTRYKPMIVPPKPWRSTEEGGYMWLKSELMRYHGCQMQQEALESADLSTLHQGLNILGQVPWKINKRVLEVAWKCWEQDIPLGDIPTRVDYELPPEPVAPPPIPADIDRESPEFQQMQEERKLYLGARIKYKRMRQKNMDLRSLRCSAILKLDQAEKFKDFEKIYFPYNIDFRGRAYPIPPHLSNVGSDLSRALLVFTAAKPLGSRGLFWLKVHLANLAGKDKMTFEDRARYVDENFDKVRQSAEDPFAGERWWMGLDDPFQGLSTCMEIVRAVDSGDPASYECSLPVHMDGSCNGLQHYAALGRDRIGGKAVNLCADKEPQDVYIGVMHEVVRRVEEEAAQTLDFDTSDVESLSKDQKDRLKRNRAAKLVNGLIDRGVVKRTVMTSVYGVTFVGARTQIAEKMEEKLENAGYDIDEIENEIFSASSYLATITMQAVGDLFVGAKQTMDWLTTCARMITQHGYPVAWISPIGVPAIQPYRQKKSFMIVTLMQAVTMTDEHDDLPIQKSRQVSAFPPNYVHSLDSSHMLLTAMEMDRRGLAFSAVHDSFWTHACDIDEMNEALRDVFIDLYSKPLLEQLKASWEMRYPGLTFPDLPARGELKLEEVKDATYFFQ